MGWFARTKKVEGWLAADLQKDAVYAAHIKRQPSGPPVVSFAVSYPVEGGAYGVALERLAKDMQASRYACSVVLAHGEYQLLSVDAPNVPPDELKTAIRWRLKDMLDFHVDDAAVDVLDIPVDKNGPARAHSMYAVAARNPLIRQRQALFEQAKIPLSVIDIPEMAQRNISALIAPEGRGIAMLSFEGDDGGLLTVTYDGELYLSRRIDVPASQLAQADESLRNASFDRVTLELQRSLDHFDRQYHFIALSKLVLAPMTQCTGLQEYLATNLYLSVESIDLGSVLDLTAAPDLQQPAMQQRFFMALGAALRLEETAL